ncbi:MAG: tRNA-(ms[2]io[6]A)-hydroxylase [Pseudomonadota bacterium]
MAELDLSLAAPLTPTPPAWLAAVQADFPSFLQDHASCEKKASGMALNVASHYPDQPRLLSAMADLAVEELSHYREVIRLLLLKGINPGADQKDPYIHALNAQIRRGSAQFLLDRLLIGAVVERRGAERFALLAKHLEDQELRSFYRAIAKSEERHWHLFVELSLQHCDTDAVWPRFNELTEAEGELMQSLPARAALH